MISGLWFVTSEEHLRTLWHLEREHVGFNPFTKAKMLRDALRVDERAIERLPHLEARSLVSKYVGALFRCECEPALPKEVLTDDDFCRVPDRSVRELVALDLAVDALLVEWQKLMAEIPKTPFDEDLEDARAIAAGLLELAKKACETNGLLFGFVREVRAL